MLQHTTTRGPLSTPKLIEDVCAHCNTLQHIARERQREREKEIEREKEREKEKEIEGDKEREREKEREGKKD